LVELREQSTEAQSVKFQADSKTRQLEGILSEKTAEVEKLHIQIEEVGKIFYFFVLLKL
jgi:hypothetical protein